MHNIFIPLKWFRPEAKLLDVKTDVKSQAIVPRNWRRNLLISSIVVCCIGDLEWKSKGLATFSTKCLYELHRTCFGRRGCSEEGHWIRRWFDLLLRCPGILRRTVLGVVWISTSKPECSGQHKTPSRMEPLSRSTWPEIEPKSYWSFPAMIQTKSRNEYVVAKHGFKWVENLARLWINYAKWREKCEIQMVDNDIIAICKRVGI